MDIRAKSMCSMKRSRIVGECIGEPKRASPRRSPRKPKRFVELPMQTSLLFGAPRKKVRALTLENDDSAPIATRRARRASTSSATTIVPGPAVEVRRCGRTLQMVRRSPNIYTIDDFLTSNECEHLLKFVEQKKRKFKASFTEAEAGKKVLSTERTSTFIHFKKGADSIVRTIERRAAEIVGATSQNVEPLQVVSYTKGQKFNLHHDAATLNDDGSCTDVVPPRRIATLFVYLNTLPEGMGHTEFPRLDLSVRPVACKAVLWSNLDIHSGKPCEADPMTVHKACPVPEGYRKVGLNIWVTDVDLQHLAL